jgi:phosphotransferase system enzyme I (PtsI)
MKNKENKTKKETSAFPEREEVVLEGVTICPGIGIGEASLVREDITIPRIKTANGQVEEEKTRYKDAIKVVVQNLHEHIKECHDYPLGNIDKILEMHEIMATDEQFHAAVLERIAFERKNAEWAIVDESANIIHKLEASRDAYLQARAEDVFDLANNILTVLAFPAEAYRKNLQITRDTQILVSANLHTSQVVKVSRTHVRGFATESSAFSSHAAILLKNFGIPAIDGIKGLKSSVKNRDKIIIDGIRGLVIIRPTTGTLRNYHNREKRLKSTPSVKKYRPIEMRTRDGTRIQMMANIENLHQVGLVLRNNLEGVGLFRTEFLILTTDKVPDEEKQYEVYRKMVDLLSGKKLVVRTFDLGADKIEPGLERCTGKNPALGVRGIRRHLLHHPEELRTQLRALIRAAPGNSVGVLFPMITTVNDIIQIKTHVQEVKKELRAEGKPFSPHVKLGAMIEIPAAAVAIQDILREVDFVSVGTNDLIQYFMAADRDNEAVLHYSDSTNTAFMHLLRFIIERAGEVGRAEDVTICGEMASDPRLVLPLIHLGYRSFSISPVSAESIRDVISNIDLCRLNNDDVFNRAP